MSYRVTATELALLDILWTKCEDGKGITSREVRESLATSGKDISQTAVITMLGNLADKNYVDSVKIRRKKAHEYVPLITREEYSAYAVNDLMNKACLGSHKVMLSAMFEKEISEEQYENIKYIVGAYQ